jgi:glucose/arabinose dehydrogenase
LFAQRPEPIPAFSGQTDAPAPRARSRVGVEVVADQLTRCGMASHTGDRFPEWRGNLFVGAMAGRHLVRLVLDGERVVTEERVLEDLDLRIREVRQGPDGALYALGGNSLLRVAPGR